MVFVASLYDLLLHRNDLNVWWADKIKTQDEILYLLADVLRETMQSLPPIIDRFSCETIPSITIQDYLKRLVEGATCLTTPIVACMYIDRYIFNGGDFNPTSAHRLLLVTFMLADKMMCDRPLAFHAWVELGGVTLASLKSMEKDFCFAIAWELFVARNQFNHYMTMIYSKLNHKPALKLHS